MKFDYEYYTLKNGLRVFLMPTNTVNSATIAAYIKEGSSQETDETQGITHFLEHVSLTATKTWDTKAKLNEVSEFTGSRFNGSTSRELLNYYINVPYTQVPFGLQFIYEVLYECTLNPDYIEQERKIILDEISKQEDSIGFQIRQFASEALNTKKSGYNRSITGESDIFKKLSVEQVKEQYKTTHSPNKVLLSIVGNFDIKETKDSIEKLFGSKKQIEKFREYPEEGVKSNIFKTKHSPKSQLAITGLVFPALSSKEIDEKESNYVDIALSMLSGPMSSRLMDRLREKENLLYRIYADYNGLETHGFSDISFDIPPELFEKTLKIVMEELEKFYTKGPTEKELAHYKEYISNREIIHYDNVFPYSGLIRSALLWDMKVIDLDQKIKIIKDATLDDINSMIKKILDIKKVNCLVFGNVNEEMEKVMKENLKRFVK